eukprot:scaffold77003_cov33-Tisochrysis_lutea.AAC.2
MPSACVSCTRDRISPRALYDVRRASLAHVSVVYMPRSPRLALSLISHVMRVSVLSMGAPR